MRIRSIEVERQGVKHLGMKKRKDVFYQLKKILRNMDLLPDEYFIGEDTGGEVALEMPNYDFAKCIPSYGVNEGIYLDITLLYRDKNGQMREEPFITGKMLDESVESFLNMTLTAAVCSLLLNGRGRIYRSEGAVLILDKNERAFLERFLESNCHLFSGMERQDYRKVMEKLQCGINCSNKVD